MKALIHINTEQGMTRAQGNLKNLLKFDDVSEIIALINGPAITLVTQDFPFIEGIKYQVCRNSLQSNHIDENTLDVRFEVVPSGVHQILILQNKGYGYIKP